MDKLYTRFDVADILRISVISIDREIKRGRLKCRYFGKSVRITPKDLESYIDNPNSRKRKHTKVGIEG